MSAPSSSSDHRKKQKLGTIVACPIIYGSSATYLGKKADEFATHRWTLYLRSPNNEDLSSFVQKVAFTLHPSFAMPVREVKTPPFEVTELGWGEFEAGIRVFFKDQDEQPVDLFHPLRLYPAASSSQAANPKKPVVSENYDELVFAAPSEKFFRLLLMYGQHRQLPEEVIAASSAPLAPGFDEAADVERLGLIHDVVRRELAAAKLQLLNLEGRLADARCRINEANSNVASTTTVSSTSTTLGTVHLGDAREQNVSR